MSDLTQQVGAVVIGRNEGQRLFRCLLSLKKSVRWIVYVDSGSTDNSVAMASECGVECIQLDTSTTFSAGRARNTGFEQLMALHPELTAVQFVDGDCELDPDWIVAGYNSLMEHSEVAAVCGRRRERFPNDSLFNQLIDFEWDTPVGECSASGGDFLIKAHCFQNVGGFNTQVVAGEEPELGFRLRQRGWKILRLDHEMTLHDAALKTSGQWWKREKRSGYGGLDVHLRTTDDSHSYFARHVWSTWFWSLGWISLPGLLCVSGGYSAGIPGALSGLALWFLATAVQILRIASRYRRRQLSLFNSVRLAGLTLISKWPQMLGQLAWMRDRWLGRNPRLIEYKSEPPRKRAFAS